VDENSGTVNNAAGAGGPLRAVSMADLQNRRMLSRAAAVMLAIGNLTGSLFPSLVKWAEGTGDY
jgi:hypothetical protein